MGDDAAAPDGRLSDAAQESAVDAEATEAELEHPADDDVADTEQAVDEQAVEEQAEEPDEAVADEEPKKRRAPLSAVAWALMAGLLIVVALAGVAGWLGWTAYQDRQAQEKRNLFLQVGRQGAVNLTTIDFEHVDDDVKRILDSATGTFYDEFQGRSQPFAQVVKQVKSKSVGNVTEAGVESDTGTEAQVLVAVTVNTTVEGQPDQAPRAWRMRILVQETGAGEAKVANVEFVP